MVSDSICATALSHVALFAMRPINEETAIKIEGLFGGLSVGEAFRLAGVEIGESAPRKELLRHAVSYAAFVEFRIRLDVRFRADGYGRYDGYEEE